VDVQDRILVIVNALPNQTVPGRTILQKLIYFCAVKTADEELQRSFRPHFYGPYSQFAAAELLSLSALGFLEESSESLVNGLTRFSYSLTDDGNKIVEAILNNEKSLVQDINSVVTEIAEHDIWESTMDISAAAKIHFILSQSKTPLNVQAIEEHAKELGWTLEANKIKSVVAFLESLALVRTQPEPTDNDSEE